MICAPCARAADNRAPRDQHCTNPACMCGHRADRYRAEPPGRPRLRTFKGTAQIVAAVAALRYPEQP